jgi:hypothetical protein
MVIERCVKAKRAFGGIFAPGPFIRRQRRIFQDFKNVMTMSLIQLTVN